MVVALLIVKLGTLFIRKALFLCIFWCKNLFCSMNIKQETAISVKYVDPGWLISREAETTKVFYKTQFADILHLSDHLKSYPKAWETFLSLYWSKGLLKDIMIWVAMKIISTRSSGRSAPLLLAPVESWGALRALLGAFRPLFNSGRWKRRHTQFSVKIGCQRLK